MRRVKLKDRIVHVRVEEAVYTALVAEAERMDRSTSSMIRIAVLDYLQRNLPSMAKGVRT